MNPQYGVNQGQCCGIKSYDSRYFFCHANKIYKKCGGSVYNIQSSFCCNNLVASRGSYGSNAGCCYNRTYDSRSEFCFSSKVHKKCGLLPYNPVKNLCCSKSVVPKIGGSYAACCVARSYDSRQYFCYGSKIISLCGKKRYNPVGEICCDSVIAKRTGGLYAKCCGKNSYDQLSAFCSEKTVHR